MGPKGWAATVGVIATAVLPTSRAGANNFGASDPNDGVYLADSWLQHYSFQGPWPSGQRTEVALIMGAYGDQTDLQVEPAPDNQVWGANLMRIDNGQVYSWVAGTVCRPGASIWGTPHHTVCQVKNIKYNNSVLATPLGSITRPFDQFSAIQRKYITCHEYGHSVGLRHSNDGYGTTESGQLVPSSHPAPSSTCMESGVFGTLGLRAHDIDHINAHYL